MQHWPCGAEQPSLQQVELGVSYSLRLTSLSLVIGPSVFPLDQNVVIAALTAALSLMTPLAKDMRLAHARSNHGPSSP